MKKLLKALFYNEARSGFSRTATMNLILFLIVITAGIVGIWLLITGKEVNAGLAGVIYGFISTLFTAGVVQYSYGKKLHKENNDNGDTKLP